MPQRIFVELWDPEYGSSFAGFPSLERSPSTAAVDTEVEVPAGEWRPIRTAPGADAKRLLFVDGVRRIDALVWIADREGMTRPGLCVSYAAGTVAAEERAEIETVEVRRGIFTSVADVEPLASDAGTYQPLVVPGETVSQLTSGVQEGLRRLEAQVSGSASGFDLMVIDGPLSSHHSQGPTVGYVKSHHVSYLDRSLEPVVHRLKPYERTPLFLTTTSWKRYSAYLRLEGEKSHPWSGIVRLEISDKHPLAEAQSLANVAAATIPKFSSVGHKDPRAPQNLFPIGGLERELRRRLGDRALVHRALLAAAARTA